MINREVADLQSRIEMDLCTLRSLIDAPVCLDYGSGVSIEVRPHEDDGAIGVRHDALGVIVAKYLPDGVSVEYADKYDGASRWVLVPYNTSVGVSVTD